MSVDIGTGDGKFVLDQAKKYPEKLCIGIDAVVAQTMAKSSRQATKKPKKGGMSNVIFVCASVENLPQELAGIATEITILYPWGSLLRSLIEPNVDILRSISKLARPGATFTLLLNYAIFSDRNYLRRLNLPQFNIQHKDKYLAAYAEASLAITQWELLQNSVPYHTTWGQKLTRKSSCTALLIAGKII